MGMYDTYRKGDIDVQLKAGDPILDLFKEGDKTPLEDGVYLGYYGFVCINNGKVVSINNKLFTTDGSILFTSEDLLTFDSKFYKLLYGEERVYEKKLKIEKAIEQFNKLVKRGKNAKTKSRKTSKRNKTK